MLNFFRNRFFRSTFLTYTLLTGGLILSFYFVFLCQMKSGQEEKIRQESQAKAELMTQIADEKFSAVELVAASISTGVWSPYVASKSDILYSRIDYFKRQEICKEMGVFNDILRVAKSTAVLFPQKNLAIDRVSFWECERYFNSVGLPADMLETIGDAAAGNYSAQVLVLADGEGSGGDFIIVKQLEYDASPRELLFVLVDGKQFAKFVRTNMPDAVSFEIRQGDTLIYAGQEGVQEGMTGLETASRLYPWRYRFFLDPDTLGKSPLSVNVVVLSGLGLLLLVIVAAYLLARLTYRPVAGLLEKFGRKRQEQFFGLEGIEHVYQELKVEKEDMEELANQYYRIGENGFLCSLLLGTYEKDRVDARVKQFHTDFTPDMAYMVIGFSNLNPGQQDIFMDVMLKLQIDCYHRKISAVLCSISEMQAMILGAIGGKEELLHQAEKISMLVDEYLSELDVELYAGTVHTGYWGIHQSYQEVKDKVMKSKSWGEQLAYYYPFEVEIRMINYMRIGNFTEAGRLLSGLESENRRRNVVPEIESKVIDLVYEGFRRFATDMGLIFRVDQGRYRELAEAKQIGELWRFLNGLLTQLEEAFLESRQFKSLGHSIVKYVEENYTCSGLSQQDIADHFGISRSTVSKVFKETVSMNFIDYLHRLRVEHAKKQFSLGVYDVVRVAKESGYENEVTFKRAFLKNEAMTPREYVKMKKAEVVSTT